MKHDKAKECGAWGHNPMVGAIYCNLLPDEPAHTGHFYRNASGHLFPIDIPEPTPCTN